MKINKQITKLIFAIALLLSLMSVGKITAKADTTHMSIAYQVSGGYNYDGDEKEYFYMSGKKFTFGARKNRDYDMYASYNVEGATKFNFQYGHIDNSYNGEGEMRIYLDGVLSSKEDVNADMLVKI